jgi:hypothetical protein
MTHTLHRIGSDESLCEDYVVLIMPSKDINHEGSALKLKRFVELALQNRAVKIGDARLGNEYHQGGRDKMMANVEDRAVIHAVFKDQESLISMLKALKTEDLGLSVVVSGLFDNVQACCKQAGIEGHTVNQSLGRWGRTDRLPPDDILEINTMCGHGMVTVDLIEKIAKEVKEGSLLPEEGAENLFRPCMCGIFNPYRAAKLLRKMAARQ